MATIMARHRRINNHIEITELNLVINLEILEKTSEQEVGLQTNKDRHIGQIQLIGDMQEIIIETGKDVSIR